MEKKELYKKLANEELRIEDVFSDDFMQEHTEFTSFGSFTDELEERGNRSKAGTEKILQAVIFEKTIFKNFEKMKEAAIDFYCLNN